MKKHIQNRMRIAMLVACGAAAVVPGLAIRAEITDISPIPLANSPSDAVLPNLMYILDDSGSMMWDYMPDNVQTLTTGQGINNCKTATVNSYSVANTQCGSSQTSTWGEPPYYATQFNQIYYNPNITYSPGVSYLGVSMGAVNPANAQRDAYYNTDGTGSNLRNLVTGYSEIYYCNITNPTTAQLSQTTVCRRNGIDNLVNGYFMYWSNAATNGGYPMETGTASTSFIYQIVKTTGHPYYFSITPNEYCSDENLVNCQLANADGSAPAGFSIPAPVRYCTTTANAAALTAVSDAVGTANPQCHQKFAFGTYQYPRYGRFTRTDIVSTTATYAKSATSVRTDCAAATYCTYAEELQNFANWYSYYSVRMQMMKTATGRAFLPIDARYRLGFLTINPNSPVTSDKYLPLATNNATQKSAWYSMLYQQTNNGSTPLRQALSRIGRHYGGVTSGINNGMPQNPIQYSCQQNFTLLTTDGYYNDSASNTVNLTGGNVGNQDATVQQDPMTLHYWVDRGTTGTLDAVGATNVVTTPTTIVEQQICSGSNNSSFGGGTGTQQACSCSVGPPAKTKVLQRTTTQTNAVTTTEGVQTGNTNTFSYAFSNITGCTTPLVVTTTNTAVTETEQTVCSGSGNTAFSTGGSGGGIQNPSKCGCSGSNTAKQQRILTYNKVVVTTDGVAAAPTYNSNSSSFSVITACSSAAKSVTLSPNPTVVTPAPTASNNGGTTLTSANFTISPNPQTTVGTSTSTPTSGGTADTLADVAMYYYKTDLITSGALATNNVPTTDNDFTPQQHMTTFTLGLGLQGLMNYTSDYLTNPNSDFSKIKAGATGCSFTSGICDWPAPVAATPTALDDLWHAAVNGRGTYFSASDPNSLAEGLASTLAALKVQTAAASASATSSPNITQTSNFIYSTTFRTVKWDGEVQAQQIDVTTGNVLAPIVWSAQAQLDGMVTDTTDSRTIYTFSSVAANKLKAFTWANLTAAEQAYFTNQCLVLSQCSLLTTVQQAAANNGSNMVGYLRGQTGNMTDLSPLYRQRDHVLGDPVDATPAYIQAPVFTFGDLVTPTYASFKTANASRQGVLYVAANDGYLHAFNGTTGVEMWAYVPRIVFPTMANLATDNWDVTHHPLVDGSPQLMDVFNGSAWKTILVAGLDLGGRGYYALDVTDPANPKGMWEVCSDSTLCANNDTDIGYSYGNPVVTKRASDGKWVVLVTSGYNNLTPGTGKGFLYVLDAFTGAILQKIGTGVGSTTTPSGFSKIAAYSNNFASDNTGLFVYGGDLLGNVWRFNMQQATPTVLQFATLVDGSNKPQSITARPELGTILNNRIVFVGTGRYLGATDLPDPSTETPALPWAYQQSLYALKDTVPANASGGGYGNPRSGGNLIQQFLTDSGGTFRTISQNAVNWTSNNGWFVDFNPGGSSPGERVNLDPQLILGTLLVITNVPNNNACTVGGDSFVYQFDYGSGSNVVNAPNNLVATKSIGQTTVGAVVVRLPSGVFKTITTGASGVKTTQGVNVGGGFNGARRVSWREIFQ